MKKRVSRVIHLIIDDVPHTFYKKVRDPNSPHVLVWRHVLLSRINAVCCISSVMTVRSIILFLNHFATLHLSLPEVGQNISFLHKTSKIRSMTSLMFSISMWLLISTAEINFLAFLDETIASKYLRRVWCLKKKMHALFTVKKNHLKGCKYSFP